MDTFLVPHDGLLDQTRETMLLDKAFGRWVQELGGRKVLVIIDTCHSGGQIQGVKAPAAVPLVGGRPKFARGVDVPGVDPRAPSTKKHILDRENALRIKSIARKDAAVLAACTHQQFAFEREDKVMGVMTYVIVQMLAQGQGKLTLEDVARRVQVEVPKYTTEHYPGSPQTPVFSDETPMPRALLRP
jgi:hypothetical protein